MTNKQKAKRVLIAIAVAILMYFGYTKFYNVEAEVPTQDSTIVVNVDTVNVDTTKVDTIK